MTLILLVANVAVWGHAVHAAQAAASQGLAAARSHHGTAADGHRAARSVLDQLGNGPLRNATVTVERGTAQTEVWVDGNALSVLPFLELPVHAQAAGPTEEFQPAPEATP
ncbi:pilus assembly protein TadE [Streptomyces sp. 3MP-14]|uniref:Pilus assembly protein TadE n=2 Tax=Streptomyces TaxID=1883 RepID=A0A5N6AD17_9ACTN|nr:pilus assembly protein TadE [Streptomyces mimosae]KAB8179242.1 pilus assembly protein TadE [Streptomyces sp. 3MP-14]